MKQTVFFGIASVRGALGAFLASIHRYYSAYGCFAAAVLMALIAILVTCHDARRLKRGRKELGSILIELSQCEAEAYSGENSQQYDRLIRRIDAIKAKVGEVAKKYLEPSVESRFLAVRVLDTQLDEATRAHFIDRAQGNFWTVFQQIKGWRGCIERILQEMPR